MTKTKYYDLQMDDPQDDYDVEVVNANLKKIDEQMKTRENATDALQEPEFTVAEKRENIASKEKMPKILGKIAKFFTDLKTVAFSGKYSDLDGKPAIVNNNTATEAGSALDARQANPTIEGTMANQISQLNSDLSDLTGSLNQKINSLNPSNAIRLYKRVGYLATSGGGWYRFAEIICLSDVIAKGSECQYIETTVRQTFNNALGCFHKVSLYLIYADRAKMTVVGQGTNVLNKVRAVRKNNIIYLDVYSSTIKNETEFLINIPFKGSITSAKCVEPHLVPETADGEVIVCSVDLPMGK